MKVDNDNFAINSQYSKYSETGGISKTINKSIAVSRIANISNSAYKIFNSIDLAVPQSFFKKSNTCTGNTLRSRPHEMEFISKIKHDENFNNNSKTLKESWAAALILKNPRVFSDTVNKVLKKIDSFYPLGMGLSAGEQDFKTRMGDDVSKIGQFARIERNEIASIFKNECDDSVTFTKKILLVKAFGAFLIDFVLKKPDFYGFLNAGNNDLSSTISSSLKKYKIDEFFDVRGRTGNIKYTPRNDLGITDEKQLNSFTAEMKDFLLMPDLAHDRPLFRTRLQDKSASRGGIELSPFVNSQFDEDNPLIGAISGSTCCIMVAANVLCPDLSENEKNDLAIAAVALLVGGGYHSVNEVLSVASPNMNLQEEIKARMSEAGEMGAYIRAKSLLDHELVN
ncbi:hypothetical protein [Iodobacter fluviatilis]|uniref:Uncharacterized protein n=1 Tax=Iodobacter fluviatilis TaxID=537 RepID=A0A377Q8N1_9NEIS|nr:hypothetical protein [Iodobacter fluviatilis]TCU86880.1 hypothetical protein EV682_1055 [Iodobacter fluviatilis]STQ90211.1 Uncharacterised protein [Iodobacter fluviatilis]